MKDDLLLQLTPPKQNTESSLNSLQNIIYSIMSLDKPELIKKKLDSLKTLVELNDVEKQIIKNIVTSLDLNNEVNADYIKEKFSYYFNLSPERKISLSKIDVAITDVRTGQSLGKLTEDLMKFAGDVPDLASTEIKERFRELSESSIISTRLTTDLENGLQKSDNAYEDLAHLSGTFTYAIPEIETNVGKAARGHVISILAYTGSFKSTYALKLAYENAMLGHNIVYFSLESTESLLVTRIVLDYIAQTAESRKDLITQNELRDRTLKDSEIKHYNKKHNELINKLDNHLQLYDKTKFSYNTFAEMTETLRQVDEKFKKETGKGLDMIVLDQLSLMKYTEVGGRKATYDGAIMNEWMIYFGNQALNFLDEDERQICFVNVAQVGREAYREASKQKNRGRYSATAASDSHEIERTSDTIITLYKDLDTANTLLVHVPKSRHGATTDEPVQVEVYGEYFHIGALSNIENEQITAESFVKTDFDLNNLLKMK